MDEAHRTTGSDLGNYLMAGLPNATYIGLTGTPIDKTVYGGGTFKTFGCEDDKGYLHKYSIAESIEDGTTLPLFYSLAPNALLVPHEVMEKEFFSLAETEGIADIEELNKILDRAVNSEELSQGQDADVGSGALCRGPLQEQCRALGLQSVSGCAWTGRPAPITKSCSINSCHRNTPRSYTRATTTTPRN